MERIDSERRFVDLKRAGAIIGVSIVLATCSGKGDGGQNNEPTTEIPAQECISPAATFPEQSERTAERYPEHTVNATVFWIGEPGTPSNGFIQNTETAWDTNSVETFGGVDDPAHQDFEPKHNPYYVALPAGEFTRSGPISGARESSPWAGEAAQLGPDQSLFRGRWLQITGPDGTAYAQWIDVGPCAEQDYAHVFGTAEPVNTFGQRAGIDLSPRTADHIGIDGSGEVSWSFIDEPDVPEGPWREYPQIDNRTHWE